MNKRFTFTEDEYNRILSDKDILRKDNEKLVKLVKEKELEIESMKLKGDDVLVVVKNKDKKDEYHFKTKEKDIIRELIKINKEYSDKIEILLNYEKELKEEINKNNDSIKKSENDIEELEKELKDKLNYIKKLKNRNFIERIINKLDLKDK